MLVKKFTFITWFLILQGAFWGSVAGIAVGLFLNIGQILYPAARNLLSISVKGCPGFNSSESSGMIYPKDPVYK